MFSWIHLTTVLTREIPGGGLFIWATLPEGLDSKAMLPRALQERVAYVPGTGFYADGNGRREMRLNFSTQTSETIREGVRRLAGVVASDIDLRDTFAADTRWLEHWGFSAFQAPNPATGLS